MRRRQGAYEFIKCTPMQSLGTNFLVVITPSNQTLPSLSLNTKTGFLQLKEAGPYKLT
jgi:hypothetical protein